MPKGPPGALIPASLPCYATPAAVGQSEDGSHGGLVMPAVAERSG
jgi:hypothetical protein